jgi:hypothetical protein
LPTIDCRPRGLLEQTERRVVQRLQERSRPGLLEDHALDERVEAAHHQGGGHAVARDVADAQIEEIRARKRGLKVVAPHVGAGDVPERDGQALALDVGGDEALLDGLAQGQLRPRRALEPRQSLMLAPFVFHGAVQDEVRLLVDLLPLYRVAPHLPDTGTAEDTDARGSSDDDGPSERRRERRDHHPQRRGGREGQRRDREGEHASQP